MKRWYVLHTQPHQEARVARHLEEQEIETYLPRQSVRSGATGLRIVPYFPCYLFAHMDLALIGPRWKWTPGLRSIVTFAGVPASVPSTLIEALRQQLATIGSATRANRTGFKPGDAVRVTHGPMTDLVGQFEREHSSADRVSVLLTYLGRVCRVHLNVSDLEKTTLSPTPAPPPRTRRTRGRGRPIAPRGRVRERT